MAFKSGVAAVQRLLDVLPSSSLVLKVRYRYIGEGRIDIWMDRWIELASSLHQSESWIDSRPMLIIEGKGMNALEEDR